MQLVFVTDFADAFYVGNERVPQNFDSTYAAQQHLLAPWK